MKEEIISDLIKILIKSGCTISADELKKKLEMVYTLAFFEGRLNMILEINNKNN